jgi:regulation of enolase protein 1 (concanavalin A-like superfamily)
MWRSVCAALALAAAGLSCSRALAADKPVQIVPGFGAVVDPDGDCRISDRVKFTIGVPGTTHGLTFMPQPGQNKSNSPRLLQDVKGDFQVAVKVAAFPTPPTGASTTGRSVHQAAGLLIWIDDHNFIRLERAGSGGKAQPWIYFERFEDGQSVKKRFLSIDNTDTYLHITRTGDTLAFRSSDDGQAWSKVQTVTTKLPEQLTVGLHAINSSVERFTGTIEVLTPESGEGFPSFPADASNKPQIVRSFSGSLDPDGDCKIAAQPVVTITVPGANHDLVLKPPYVKQNAPRVLDDIKGDFRLAVKIAKFPTPKADTSANNQLSYVGAGVLIWKDDRNYLRLERAAEGNAGSHYAFLEGFLDGKEICSEQRDVEDRDAYLSVTRQGNNFTFETSTDGSEWTKLKTLELKLPDQLKAGVAAINTTTSPFSATIEVPKSAEGDK